MPNIKGCAIYTQASKRTPDKTDGKLLLKLKGKDSGQCFYYIAHYLETSICEHEEDLLLFDVEGRIISAYLSEIEYLIIQ